MSSTLSELLEDDDAFDFIIMDGSNSVKEAYAMFCIDLPSIYLTNKVVAVRFARLRLEKRHKYAQNCSELAVKHFISGKTCNVRGLILAGSADFKKELILLILGCLLRSCRYLTSRTACYLV